MSLELAALDAFTGLSAFTFFCFAIFDALSRFRITGPLGARLYYELEFIMGGLLGLGHYSLMESAVLLTSSILSALPLLLPNAALPGTLGLLVLAAYNAVCAFYARVVYISARTFVAISAGFAWLLVWRAARFMPVADLPVLLTAVVAVFALVSFSVSRMRARRFERLEVNERFESVQRFCAQHPHWEWERGADAPIGFDEWEV